MVMKTSDLSLQLRDLPFDVAEVQVFGGAWIEAISGDSRGLDRARLRTLKSQLVTQAEQFEVKFLKLALQFLSLYLPPEGLFYSMKDREVVLFMAVVIGLPLNP